MNILKALKSSELADNMVAAFTADPSIQRYPFFPNIEQITPNTQNYPLHATPEYTLTSPGVIRDKIPRVKYLRGIISSIEIDVSNNFVGGASRTASFKPFDLASFGFYKLFKYFRILQNNKEIKRIDFNNILDIITSKYDSFTADSIFNIASNDEEFKDKGDDSNTTLTASIFIPFSFSQMSKLCMDTSFLAPLEFELVVGNDFDSNKIYTAIYNNIAVAGQGDRITVNRIKIINKYQFTAIEEALADGIKKDLYLGLKPRMNLDFGYVSYKSGSIAGAVSPKETTIKLDMGKLVKRYYIRAFLKNNDASGNTDSEFVDGSDKITYIKILSGSNVCVEYSKNENQLITILLGNSYRQSSANSIFGGYTIDMTNGFLQEKNNDYSSGFPEYYIEDPKLILTTNNTTNTELFVYVTSEYYEVHEVNPSNGLITLIGDK
jgi:hypothetical protein